MSILTASETVNWSNYSRIEISTHRKQNTKMRVPGPGAHTSSINARRSWIIWSLVFRNANIIRKQAVFCCFSAFSQHILSTKLSTEEFLLSLQRSTDLMKERQAGRGGDNWSESLLEFDSTEWLVILILNTSWAYLINRTINFTTASRAYSVKPYS